MRGENGPFAPKPFAATPRDYGPGGVTAGGDSPLVRLRERGRG
jgi:hypothetical protein